MGLGSDLNPRHNNIHRMPSSLLRSLCRHSSLRSLIRCAMAPNSRTCHHSLGYHQLLDRTNDASPNRVLKWRGIRIGMASIRVTLPPLPVLGRPGALRVHLTLQSSPSDQTPTRTAPMGVNTGLKQGGTALQRGAAGSNSVKTGYKTGRK